jgi:hypothetical protein
MTPRTIESEFTDILQKQMRNDVFPGLTLDGPLFDEGHPKVLWATLQFQNGLRTPPESLSVPGLTLKTFGTIEEAKRAYPEVSTVFYGQPWCMHEFLNGQMAEALVDFAPLGAALLSRTTNFEKESGEELHQVTLPLWINYALSPELWGPNGKWPRFHQILNDVFREHDLLDSESYYGYYPLKSKAEKLADLGIKGTRLEKSYLLVLPWTFSKSDLDKLVEIIRQEF